MSNRSSDPAGFGGNDGPSGCGTAHLRGDLPTQYGDMAAGEDESSLARPEDVSLNMTAETRQVILDALDVAAEYRRDRVETCADCRDGTCPDCAWRLQMVAEYERTADAVIAAPKLEARPELRSGRPRHDP